MIFNEAGQFTIRYLDDQRALRLWQERWIALLVVAFAVAVVPFIGSDYLYSAILVPWLVFSLAGLGLNLVTGYAGQLSLGSAAFMAVGAFASYNFLLRIPGLPLLAGLALGGLVAAAVGVVFGLPSARIKGFYLIVSTLAAQFLIQWVFTHFGWFSNFNSSGVISAPPLVIGALNFGSPSGRYLLTLLVVIALTWLAHRLVRSDLGRNWMAVRDMDTAAAVIGIPVVRTKLAAFAISSFYLGVAGALWAFTYLGTVEPHGFDLTRSFQVLFIIIIGGMGSIAGNFIGAAFIVLLPVLLSHLSNSLLGTGIDVSDAENFQKIAFGILIIYFLVREPDGLARLWQKLRARARVWPLRY